MELDPNVCYRIIQARDARFDGKFFTAVTTTGVYCRPICPAGRQSGKTSSFFFARRPRKRRGFGRASDVGRKRHPALPPGTGHRQPSPPRCGSSEADSWTSIPSSELADGSGSVSAMCAGFSWSTWALRRTRLRNPAARISPRACSVTRNCPCRTVALSAGFGSIRQFNDVFRSVFGEPPRAFRRAGQRAARRLIRAARIPESAQHVITLSLSYRPPLAWDQLHSFLEKRAIPAWKKLSARHIEDPFPLGGQWGRLRSSRLGAEKMSSMSRFGALNPRCSAAQ